MSITAHVYSNGKTMENQPVTFDEAMFLVEHQDTFYEDEENFLGFTSPKHQDAVIQFVREEEDKWVVDVPVVREDTYMGSYVTVASHSKVVTIITNFFMPESVLRQSIEKQAYELLIEEFGTRWGLGMHLVTSEHG